MSPYNWVIHPLTQPQMAYQKKFINVYFCSKRPSLVKVEKKFKVHVNQSWCRQSFFVDDSYHHHIFQHIKGPLSSLFWGTDKCRSEDLRGGAFSIPQTNKPYPI